VVPVELGGDEIDALVASLWLSDRQSDDRVAIGMAVARLLADMARNGR
jgi:hypothetical protein